MKEGERLGRAIELIGYRMKDSLIAGTVVSVTGTECVVEPLDGTPNIEGVLLTAGGNGFLQIPKLQSLVYVQAGEEYTVKLYSDIERLEANADVIFNLGTNGGLVKVSELVAKINALEQQINSHQHLYITPAGTPAPTTPDLATNPLITPTTVTEIENPKVKH